MSIFTNQKSRWIVGVGAAALVLLLALVLRPTGTWKVTIATWPGFAIGEVSKELGLFGDLTIDVRTIDDPTARLTAFRTGQSDVMISSLDVFAQESANGIDGRIFMVTDSSAGADGIVAHSEIANVNALAGKSVAVAKGAPSHFFLYVLLDKNGMKLDEVHLVFFDDPTLAGQALISGRVDAAVTWEPLLSQIVDKGQGRLLASTADTPDTIVDVLVGSSKFLGDQQRLGTFIEGWQKGIAATRTEPQKANPIVAKTLSLPSPKPGEDLMKGVALADLGQNKKLLCSPSQGSPAEAIIARAQQFWISAGVLTAVKPKPDALIDRFVCSR